MADGDGAPRPSPSPRRARLNRLLMAALFMISMAAGQLSTGWPPDASRWVLLVVASVGAAFSTAPVPIEFLPATPHTPRRRPSWRSCRRFGLVGLAVVVAIGAGRIIVMVAAPASAAIERWRHGCPTATLLQVVTSPDQLAASRELADAYEVYLAREHHGCATAELYVYAAESATVRAAIAAGWTPDLLGQIGPRPDVWLPGAAQATIAEPGLSSNGRLSVVDSEVVAASPVVLAVPAAEIAAGTAAGRNSMTWEELLTVAARSGWRVARPDPGRAAAGELATLAIYASVSERPGRIAAAGPARAVERQLGQGLDLAGYPIGNEAELLCHYRRAGTTGPDAPPVGLIASEQAMVRANSGEALGGACPGRVPAAPAGGGLFGFYPPDTRALEYPLVRLGWSDTTGRVRAAAQLLRDWLVGAGRAALADLGLRPSGFTEAGLVSERYGALAGATFRHDPPGAEVRAAVADRYAEARRPGRVLLAVDASESMRRRTSGGATRFETAAVAVRHVLDLLGSGDEFGLWVFPDGTRATRTLVPIGPAGEPAGAASRRVAAQRALSGVRPGGATPLFRTILDGVQALSPAGPDRVSALVVISDGANYGPGPELATLLAGVPGRGVRVFVLAVGVDSCSGGLDQLTRRTGGGCTGTALESLDADLGALVEALWAGTP